MQEEREIEVDRQKVIDQVDPITGDYLIYRWEARKMLNYLDLTTILQLEQQFERLEKLDQKDFVWLMIQSVPHERYQIVYLIAGAITLYNEVQRQRKSQSQGGIHWREFTEYLLEAAFNSQNMMDMPATRLVEQNTPSPDAPFVFGARENNISSIKLSTKWLDKHHHDRSIRQAEVACGTNTKNSSSEHIIITLDQSSSQLRLYKSNSSLSRIIRPSPQNHILESIILDFAWSAKELRIGAVLQDNTITFWDYLDNFSFEKYLQTTLHVENLQTKIWYIDLGLWLTTDQSFTLFEWNIEEETCVQWPKRHKKPIVILLDLPNGKMATAALDRTIVLWEISTRTSLSVLVLSEVSAHSIVYSYDFEYLVSAGYEMAAIVWKVQDARDCSVAGKLEGHTHTISAMNVIRKTSIAITSDDAGFIKTWDLRNFRCLQTLNMDRMEINKILTIQDEQFFCAVGSRLYWFEYELVNNTNANGVNNVEIIPSQILYNDIDKEIIVATKSDLRIVCAYTGKVMRIIADIVGLETELSCLELIGRSMKVLVGGSSGQIRDIQHSNGMTIHDLEMHKEEIIGIYYSSKYRIVVTGAWDNKIKVWNEENLHEPVKVLENVMKTNMGCFNVSFKQGMLVTANENGFVYNWDLYTFQLKAGIKLNNEINTICLIDDLPVVIIGEGQKRISFWNFYQSETLNVPLCVINFNVFGIQDSMPQRLKYYIQQNQLGNTFMTDQGQKSKYTFKLFCGLDQGTVYQWNLSQYLNGVKELPPVYEPSIFRFVKINGSEYLSFMKATESEEINTDRFSSVPKEALICAWRAHYEGLTDLKVLNISSDLCITIGYDQYLRIWDFNGKLQAALILNRSDAQFWNLSINTFSYREQLFGQAEELLEQLKEDYNLEYQEVQFNKSKELVKIDSLKDIKSQQRIPRRQQQKQQVRQQYVSLRQMDIRKKATDSFSQLFGAKKPSIKYTKASINQNSSSDEEEFYNRRKLVAKTEMASQLANKLDILDNQISSLSQKNNNAQNNQLVNIQVRQQQLEATRKKLQDASRSRSVPILPRRQFRTPQINKAVVQKQIKQGLVQKLNQDVKRARNNRAYASFRSGSRQGNQRNKVNRRLPNLSDNVGSARVQNIVSSFRPIEVMKR